MMPEARDLLLSWDEKRERSLQTELGVSSLGGCRRAAGYTLAGTVREQSGSSLPAVIGTAVHLVFAEQARAMVETGELPAGTLIEEPVRFAGVLGHLDLYVPRNGSPAVLTDLKTVRDSGQVERHRAAGPPERHQWQVMTYAAALLIRGYDVDEVQLAYIGRADGATWTWRSPFAVEPVRAAIEWLRYVTEGELSFLPRDFRPESPQCQGCPFRTACWEDRAVPGRDLRTALYRDEPDAAMWAQRLEEARLRKKVAEQQEDDARGALDALRPDFIPKGGADVKVPGLGKVLHFTQVAGRKKPDMELITADYERAGAKPPMVQGEPGFRLALTAPRE
jgi:CRISPR/Cas system-associated exonuclease Cas4 (RecB family)